MSTLLCFFQDEGNALKALWFKFDCNFSCQLTKRHCFSLNVCLILIELLILAVDLPQICFSKENLAFENHLIYRYLYFL